MIVVMEKNATEDQITHMVDRVQQLGLKAICNCGTERTVIAAVGDERAKKDSLESGPGVAEVVPILAPYKVASRELKPDPTQITVLNFKTAGIVGVMAGPCSVESEEQIITSVRAVKHAGATAYVERV